MSLLDSKNFTDVNVSLTQSQNQSQNQSQRQNQSQNQGQNQSQNQGTRKQQKAVNACGVEVSVVVTGWVITSICNQQVVSIPDYNKTCQNNQ